MLRLWIALHELFAIELYDTRACLYDALTHLMPAVGAGIQPEYVIYPRRTDDAVEVSIGL